MADSFVDIRWWNALVPFTGEYRLSLALPARIGLLVRTKAVTGPRALRSEAS